MAAPGSIRSRFSESPALAHLRSNARILGLLGALGIVMLWFFLFAVNSLSSGQPVLGVNWGPYFYLFLFYLVLYGAMLVLAILAPDRVPLQLEDEAATNFLIWGGVFLLGTTVGMLAAYKVVGLNGSPLPGTVVLPGIVSVVLFIATVEEFTFRVVLPPLIGWDRTRRMPTLFGWLTGSVFLFAVFHISAYSLELEPQSILSGLVAAGLLGAVLYLVYNLRGADGKRIFGFGGSWGIHAGYDLVTLGFVGAYGLGFIHLGIVPV